jgi:polar amino acid transport system permease protein
LPFFGISLSPTIAAVLALGLCFGAYGAEVVRAGMLSIPRGQREAALALGLKPLYVLFFIELPQAFVIMLPPFANLLVLLLKSTSVTALITVPELTFETSAISSNFGVNIFIFGYSMIAYYAMSRGIFAVTGTLEHRFGISSRLTPKQMALEPI